MSYSSGTFSINTSGQPVVTGTTISSSVFNALTADLATGLTTCVLKDGSQTITANIPMATFKFTGLGAGTANGEAMRFNEIATQAEQEATTSVITLVSPGRQQYHPSSVKGWGKLNINGTSAAQYNIASVDDNGAGDATVNWSTDFSSAHYSCVVTAVFDPAGSTATTYAGQAFASAYAGATTRVTTLRVSDGAGTDASFICVTASGDQ